MASIIRLELNTVIGLQNSDRGCVLDSGQNHFEGSADTILDDPGIQELYPGSHKEEEVG